MICLNEHASRQQSRINDIRDKKLGRTLPFAAGAKEKQAGMKGDEHVRYFTSCFRGRLRSHEAC
jgi:hypothetical protein